MEDASPPQDAAPLVPPAKIYTEIRSAIRETDGISFKLLGLVPLVSGAALLGLILQTRDLPAGLLVLLALFAATITLGLFRWELRNVQTCSWLLGYADALEERALAESGMGDVSRARPHPPQGIGKSEAEKLIYTATISAWLALPFGLGGAPPQPFLAVYLLGAGLIVAGTVASLFAARRPRVAPGNAHGAGRHSVRGPAQQHAPQEDSTVNRLSLSALVLVAALAPGAAYAQMNETVRAVPGGGISVPGWTGAVDPGSGEPLTSARLAKEGNALHVTTGPAIAYWNAANKASGNYTVKATFREPQYMNRNDHPHPYGVFIGGNDMAGDQRSYLYCAAYGNGRFIVRGFGPAPFQLNGRGEANAAVHKAAAQGQPVTQDVALSVAGDSVRCAINGTVVASYPKSAVVGAGKLKSTDGVYGIRFAHNTEGLVTGLTVTKP